MGWKSVIVSAITIIYLFDLLKILTTKLPITTVARKNGMQDTSPTYMQSHILSIHSPHSTRNTIMNECMKSVKFHLGIPSLNLCTLSAFILFSKKEERILVVWSTLL